MSKGLEALEEIRECDVGYRLEMFKHNCKIIEKELKGKDEYEYFVQEICNYLGLDDLFPYNDLKEIEKQIKTLADNSHWIAVKQDQKKLKALEIVKRFSYYDIHFLDYLLGEGKITQEEYSLLKEVLL